MFELTVRTEFAAAHCLRGYKGACEKLHGHNWKIDVVLRSARLDKLGMVMDFKEVKAALAQITGTLDHRLLNDLPPFRKANPTSENVARFIADRLAKRLPRGVRVKSVTSWESDRCGATYLPLTAKHTRGTK